MALVLVEESDPKLVVQLRTSELHLEGFTNHCHIDLCYSPSCSSCIPFLDHSVVFMEFHQPGIPFHYPSKTSEELQP